MKQDDLSARVTQLESQVQLLAQLHTKLSGQVTGALAAIRALVITHPDLGDCTSEVQHQLEALQSTTLTMPIADATIEGVEQARRQIFPSARDLQRRSGQ